MLYYIAFLSYRESYQLELSHNYPFVLRLVQVFQVANTKMGLDMQKILERKSLERVNGRKQE